MRGVPPLYTFIHSVVYITFLSKFSDREIEYCRFRRFGAADPSERPGKRSHASGDPRERSHQHAFFNEGSNFGGAARHRADLTRLPSPSRSGSSLACDFRACTYAARRGGAHARNANFCASLSPFSVRRNARRDADTSRRGYRRRSSLPPPLSRAGIYGISTPAACYVPSIRAWTRARMDDWEPVPSQQRARTILIVDVNGGVDVRPPRTTRNGERCTHLGGTIFIRKSLPLPVPLARQEKRLCEFAVFPL